MTSPRILMFDEDYESMRDFAEYIEEELGWQVDLTAQPAILERLRNERFDLILVDLMIHEKSIDASDHEVQNITFDGTPWLRTGLEFLRRLRRGDYAGVNGTSADVPVLVLSAVAGYSVELEPDLRISGYVEKPFRLEDLVDRIRRLLKD